MRCMLLLAALSLSACQPPRPPATSATPAGTTAPVEVTPAAAQDAPAPVPPEVVKAPEWKRVPTTRVCLHENIWFDSIRTPEQAAALTVGDALNSLGGFCNPVGLLPAALPKNTPVAWQYRNTAVPIRVVMDLEVVLTRGYLEHFLSRSQAAKDHETIVSGPFDAEQLKAALIGIGLKPGKPATFTKEENNERVYDFKPATGDVVKLYVQYEDEKGNTLTVPAQSWIAGKDGKTLGPDWVFAGSYRSRGKTFQGEEYDYFAANDGRVVCVTNFGTALLDLPVESADADPEGNQLGYRARTEVLPPRGTKVRVLFEPKTGPKGKK